MGERLFDHGDYKLYLRDRLPTQGSERGVRSKLADRLRCKPAFITQVLNGKVHFSVEHAIEIDRFLKHTPAETEYFLLLVYKGRAGTKTLETFYDEKLELIRRQRLRVAERVSGNRLTKEASHQYYSSWIYSALHVLTMVPGMGTEEALADRLGLQLQVVHEAMAFLIEFGLVERVEGFLKPTARRVHLAGDSTMITKHHTNWRIRSLHSLDSKDPLNLHYSGPLALSRKNAQLIRSLVLELIARLEPIVLEPGEEELYGVALDFFRL